MTEHDGKGPHCMDNWDEETKMAILTIFKMADILGWAICITEAKDKNVGGIIIGHPAYLDWVVDNIPKEYPGPSAGQELDS